MRKSTLLPLALLAYLGLMSYIGYPGYKDGTNSPAYYFGVIGVTLLIIISLHFFIKKRERLRNEREEDIKRNSNQLENQ